MAPEKEKKLKTGFTTGAAAAAAVKGALYLLIKGVVKDSVRIEFIGGGHREIDIHTCCLDGDKAICTVIKKAGDDPDVTNKAEIGACVTIIKSQAEKISITGGKGVGQVTKEGLEIPPGQPAINLGPQKMIRAVVSDVFSELKLTPCSTHVEVFVPRGETLAKKTLNHRLGIIGGISILGTTGIVKPMSHEAYIATIKAALSVASASGVKRVFFTTGRRSEKHAQRVWNLDKEEAFIQIGDFFEKSLVLASEMGFETVVLTVFFGKAVKMAYGVPHTHAAKSDMCMKKLSHWVVEITGDKEMELRVLGANTARQAFYLLKESFPAVIQHVGLEIIRSAKKFTSGNINIRSVIFDFEGEVIFDSKKNQVM